MDNYIEELKIKCKNKAPKHNITIKDIKVVYYLYNDDNVSHKKLARELHRSDITLANIDSFIKEWIKENNPDTNNEDFLNDILKAYLNK